MTDKFVNKLAAAVELNDSLVCVGLDPDPTLMPLRDVFAFNRVIIDATKRSVCAYKPNMAFYEALGLPGLEALEKTISYIHTNAAGVLVVGDGKRGDIKSTNSRYAQSLFDVWGFDAITVNGYAGGEALEPFLEYDDKGVFVWCRSSNLGGQEFQNLKVQVGSDSHMFYEVVAKRVLDWNTRGNVGVVVGATYPKELQNVRSLCPKIPILIPGIGAQRGGLKEAVEYGVDSNGGNAILTVSRSVIYASKDIDRFGDESRVVAESLRQRINDHLKPRVRSVE